MAGSPGAIALGIGALIGTVALVAKAKGGHSKPIGRRLIDMTPPMSSEQELKSVALMLASEDPATMDAAADELDRVGHHDAARLLRSEAAELRKGGQVVPITHDTAPPKKDKGADKPPAKKAPPVVYTPPVADNAVYYVVERAGDSFWAIAARFTGMLQGPTLLT